MSDNILAQIYRGDYRPLDRPFVLNKEYGRMLSQKTDMEDRFEAALPKEMRKEFVEYLRLSGEVEIADEEEAFCEGVRFGIRMMEHIYGGQK